MAAAWGHVRRAPCARMQRHEVLCRYFHTLPLLLWCTRLPTAVRLALWACIEAVFNIFPSTPASSAALVACHAVILAALAFLPRNASFGGARGAKAHGA